MRELHAWKFIDPYRDVARELHADSDRKIIVNARDLKEKFTGQRVHVYGQHPGGRKEQYDRKIGDFDDAWDIGGKVGFSACHYTWPGIDHWEEDEDSLTGYYTAAMHGNHEGFVVIKKIKEDQ